MLEDEDDRDFSPVGNMVPRFDRSYKPKPAPPSHTPSSIASGSGSRQLVSSQQEAEWERNLARLRDFQGIESSSRRCLTGLKNLGNTCYMNSILQVWVFLCSGTRTLQYAPNCFEHRKCIKMDLKCPTIVLNCLHILDYIPMFDLKSKNSNMCTHKGQNSQFFKMPEFRPFLRM